MRFRTYAGASRGINDVMGAFASRGGNAYGDQMRDLAYVDSARSSAARDDSEAGLNQQRFAARESLPSVLSEIPLPAGMTPGAVASMMAGSDNMNFRDFTQGLGDLNSYEAQRAALGAAQRGDNDSLNRFSTAAKPGNVYTPHVVNETASYNSATGAGQFTPGHGALVNQRNAAAGASAAAGRASDAHAELYGAQTDMERYLPVAPGYTVFQQNPNAGQPAPAQEWQGVPFEVPEQSPVVGALSTVATAPMTPQQMGAGSGGGADGTAKQQRYNELVAQGMPPRAAQAVVDGTLKPIGDANGLVKGYADVANQQTVSTIDDKGMLQLTDYGRQFYGQTAPAGAPAAAPAAAPAGVPPGAEIATNDKGDIMYRDPVTKQWVPAK